MSQSFGTVTLLPFQGTTFRLPVKLPQGVKVPGGRVPPSVCPVSIDWNLYWQLAQQPANIGVAVNLQASSVMASILDRIASVKIDNSASSVPVYVWFPDTNDVVTCAPFTVVTFPCLTNLLTCNIIALGLTAGFIPQCRVFFYNVELPPAVDAEINQAAALYKASTDIPFFNGNLKSAGYDTPALGDQAFSTQYPMVSSNPQTVLPAKPRGQWRLTHLTANIVGVAAANPNTLIGSFSFQAGITGLTFFSADYIYNNSTSVTLYQPIFNLQGMQLKLDATVPYQVTNTTQMGQGTCRTNLVVSYLPNG